MTRPVCVDLYSGLGGWSEGFLAEGYDCIGFDIERHDYGSGGYPGQLVIQDVRTLHGSQFREAACIVGSPPCQAYSYMAMPWSRGKKMAEEIRNDYVRYSNLNYLFVECFRLQWEACAAAGRYIPLIVENVRGAIPWVGRSRWHYGSFHLWGDVPALMPITIGRQIMKEGVAHRSNGETNFHGPGRKMPAEINESIRQGKSPARWTNPDEHYSGRKQGGDWFNAESLGSSSRRFSSRSASRKASSANIAKIPLPLSSHIARCFKPEASA